MEAAIAALAERQHGVMTLGQLVDLGLGARGVQTRARCGRLHRVYRGVYALAPVKLLTLHGRWLAAVLASGSHAVLSHRSAAWLHGLAQTNSAYIDVTVPGAERPRHAGVRLHRSLTLTEGDCTEVNGIPCTTVARTLLDQAASVGRRGLERALDQAEILRVLDGRALADQLERNPRHAGAGTLRAVLNEHYAGSTPTWSELEERFLALVRRAGLPPPQVNAFVDPADGEPPIRVDFAWPDQRVIVETDGHATHRTRQAFERDRRRDQRLAAAGWRVIRVTWRQLTRGAAELERTLIRLVMG